MQVCLFVGTLSIGGAERQVLVLANALVGRGHTVDLITFYDASPRALGIEIDPRVRLTGLNGPARTSVVGRCLQLMAAPARLRRLVRARGPDRVYSMLHLCNLVAWLATRGREREKLVWGYRASNMRLNWKRRVPERLCRLVSGSVPLMIANSETGRRHALDVAGWRPRRSVVVPNGIDTGVYRPRPEAGAAIRAELGLAQDALVVGTVGRIDPMKGHEIFLKAAVELVRAGHAWTFVIVGGGCADRTANLRAQAEELGLKDRMHFTGVRSDTPALYSAMDIYCSASAYGEGFPNVIAEAMACGTPCVVTNIGDSAAIVDGLGKVVPPNDPIGLRDALSELAAQSAQCNAGSLRRHIEKHFSVDALVATTVAALRGPID
ncbi:hypothetical protein CKO28_15640 [Rhodovibrio sodomensis]|uniref:Glycosyltransferase subfamily 4-like N-terminal domain-containing protein n=1 Tax=Rhodovibrio sodomensis TaxID=1088 RepID=A0ABS1DHH4_9PROT|nr:glycosyltransferase [Rhodovibrio sodomensis]MBK1669471.1 hypothetical protein [Rhodovibrio sodomensis]